MLYDNNSEVTKLYDWIEIDSYCYKVIGLGFIESRLLVKDPFGKMKVILVDDFVIVDEEYAKRNNIKGRLRNIPDDIDGYDISTPFDFVHHCCKATRSTLCVENDNRTMENNEEGLFVNGSVRCVMKMEKLPFKFDRIVGDFYVGDVGLKTLENCPNDIKGSFVCHNNQLDNLKHFPNIIKGQVHVDKLMTKEKEYRQWKIKYELQRK